MIKTRKILPFAAILLTSGAGLTAQAAYDEARVVSVEPIYETVRYSEPRQECRQEKVAYYEDRYKARSATPTIIGALIGGAIGNGLGHNKTNKRVGTAVGAILGGSIGSDISKQKHSKSRKHYSTEEVCTVVEDWHEEEQLSGYHVTYAYGGETYTTRTANHPGDSLRVRVRVTPVR